MEDKKRSRGTNFTIFEKSLLIELVTKYKSIVECKVINGTNIKQKGDTWEKITREFNSTGNVTTRSNRQLKQFYKNLKKNAKKARGEERLECFKTGGGQCTTKINKSVICLIEDQIEPSGNSYDCDAEHFGDTNNVPVIEEESCNDMGFIVLEEVGLTFIPTENQNETSTSLQNLPLPQSSTPQETNIQQNGTSNQQKLSGTEKDLPLEESAIIESSPRNKALTGRTRRGGKTPSLRQVSRDKIAALVEDRATLCRTEIKLIEEKHAYEIELLRMKKETERLNQEVAREKALYYREKRRRLNESDS